MSSHTYHFVVTWFGISSILKYLPFMHSGKYFDSVLANAVCKVVICIRLPVNMWKTVRNALKMSWVCYSGRKHFIISVWTTHPCVTIRTRPLRGLGSWPWTWVLVAPPKSALSLLARSLFSFPLLCFPCGHISLAGRFSWLQYSICIQPNFLLLKV